MGDFMADGKQRNFLSNPLLARHSYTVYSLRNAINNALITWKILKFELVFVGHIILWVQRLNFNLNQNVCVAVSVVDTNW